MFSQFFNLISSKINNRFVFCYEIVLSIKYIFYYILANSFVSVLTRSEERHELVILNFTIAIFIELPNELLNVNGHLEFILDDFDEALSIYETSTIFVTSK